jgi:hypothetical protein
MAAALHLAANIVGGLTCIQEFPDLAIGNVPRDAVSAQKETCSTFNFEDLQIDFNTGLGAKCAADHIFAGMVRRLFRGHASGPHFFFYYRVVGSFTMKFAVRGQAVEA